METFGSGDLWTELLAYGSAVAISPIHIGLLLLLLLLGPQPLQRGGWFVVSWMVTTGLMVVLLLTLGHGLLLSMEKGQSSPHRTGSVGCRTEPHSGRHRHSRVCQQCQPGTAAAMDRGADRPQAGNAVLEATKALLFKRGDLVVASLSLLLAGHLGWHGIEGLQLS